MQKENLVLTQEWDKVFPKSDKVEHSIVTFLNHFGITLAADMYTPLVASGKLPAIAVSGPFGAVKEQSSGLYAQEMAQRGYLAIAFDPSYTGESGGQPRGINAPEVNVEDFQAAVDFLSVQDNVDPEKISIIGVCGWGVIALQTACIDTRIKATVTSTMYDKSRVTGNGYFDQADNEEARYNTRVAINAQRTEDFRNQSYKKAGGVLEVVPKELPQFLHDYHDYYKTPRAYHKRSLNSNEGWNISLTISFLNTRLFTYAGEIRNAVLMVHGDKAHSFYMSQNAFKLLKGDNKEFIAVKGAVHTDLYDQKDIIPFDQTEAFIAKNIK